MQTSKSTQVIVLVVAIFLSFAGNSAAMYTRAEAYDYLKNVIIGTQITSYVAWGSVSTLAPNTQFSSGEQIVYSPTCKSWLFALDFNYDAFWGHDVELYFIDVNNLGNYSNVTVQSGVDQIQLEVVEYVPIDWEFALWGEQD